MNSEFTIIYRDNFEIAIAELKKLNQELVTRYDSTPQNKWEDRRVISGFSSLLTEHVKTFEWAKKNLHLEDAMTVYRQLVANKYYENFIKGATKACLGTIA